MTSTTVHHWRFEDGDTCAKPFAFGPSDPAPRGWYCWVYPGDDEEFRNWMAVHCPTAECVHRFNSGDPMHTVYIANEAEATLFTLRWL